MNTNAVTFFNTQKVNVFSENAGLILAAWEIINPGNIGQIIRLAHNVGANKVLFVSDNPIFKESKIRKTAGFSFDQMEWSFISKQEFIQITKTDFNLVVLETCTDSTNIFNTQLPGKSILLAGNESHGIPEEVIRMSSYKVHIPMPGNCKSMNVSHAISVAAFEWYRQNGIDRSL